MYFGGKYRIEIDAAMTTIIICVFGATLSHIFHCMVDEDDIPGTVLPNNHLVVSFFKMLTAVSSRRDDRLQKGYSMEYRIEVKVVLSTMFTCLFEDNIAYFACHNGGKHTNNVMLNGTIPTFIVDDIGSFV